MDKKMEEKMFQLHAEVCKSLASPIRLKILNSLRDKEKSVETLTELLGLHKANLSQHLAILRQRRIVTTRRAGLNVYYKIANPKMIKACDILREVLFEQLVEDKKLVKKMSDKENQSPKAVHKFPLEMKEKLDSPERKELFDPKKALSSLGIKAGMAVADIGCGTGFFSLPLASLVGEKGKVFAADISKEMLSDLRKRIKKEKLHNVKAILSQENKIPLKAKEVNYCFLALMVHELENRDLFFRELRRLLKNKGKIAIIEWKKAPSPFGPPLEERISLSAMKEMLIENKLRIHKTVKLGQYQYGIVAVRA